MENADILITEIELNTMTCGICVSFSDFNVKIFKDILVIDSVNLPWYECHRTPSMIS